MEETFSEAMLQRQLVGLEGFRIFVAAGALDQMNITRYYWNYTMTME